MAPVQRPSNEAPWTAEFDTVRRENLFRDPPKRHSAYPALQAAVQPHLGSFNALLDKDGLLEHAIREIGIKVHLDGEPGDPSRNRLSLRLKDIFVDRPQISTTNKFASLARDVLPAECRERHATYRGKMRARLEFRVNDGPWREGLRDLGQLPIMIKSKRCHLEKCSPAQLVHFKEESEELGGYFIVNGVEKLIRTLIVNRRNFPAAITRPSFANRGSSYTVYGVSIRSVRSDQTSQTNVLHYLSDGNVNFRFSWRKNEYLVPVVMILKALVDNSDHELFEGLLGQNLSGERLDTFFTDRVEMMLRTYKVYGLQGKSQTRAYLGEKFRGVLAVSADILDEQAGAEFLRKIVLPHLGAYDVTESQDLDKFRLLLFMTRKLYALVAGECTVDNPDTLQNQEVLVGGFLYGMILKEKLEDWLSSVGAACRDWCKRNDNASFTSASFSKEFLTRILPKTLENIGGALEYFLSTGNLVSPSGLDLQQTSGFTVVAEKINFYRFLSHFRMVHRGSFFADLKTTTVRKLLPESWGFLCPVHTPDGSPCGLLNHLAHKCKLVTDQTDVSALPQQFAQLGVRASSSSAQDVVVQLDGRIVGWCDSRQARIVSDTLRHWKVEGTHFIPVELEVGHVPSSNGGQYPGIYLFSHLGRMIRPVRYLPLDKEDFVGPFEQPYMSIACSVPEIVPGEHSHVEYDPTNVLSILANLTPFSDFNQSPRNMYQCQMAKQTMGTPGTALRYRPDNKAYLLGTGQTPIVRPALHNEYGMDNFPNGMNAVVAVISYTAYDMDDAMIINKSAHERGFGYGTIFKTRVIDLGEEKKRTSPSTKLGMSLFGCAPSDPSKEELMAVLDEDGLPKVGRLVRHGDVIAASHTVSSDPVSGTLVNRDGITRLHKYQDLELALVQEVRLLGSEDGNEPCTSISIKFRVPRSSIIGDKYSSRHGQKGVCSQRWPATDLPFSESGIQPDIIINPHAFPSRMTIGMFVESLAGKAGALHGLAQDSSPFRFDDKHTALEHFGQQLAKAGFNYYGNEPMYSGITGEELHADIYMGVVYYQRLRHMVNDKFQVRSTGPVTPLTGQPIKGRKRGGGIRIGEMERDSLLAHGVVFLLQDRLLNCSDYTLAWICEQCGSFLSTTLTVPRAGPKRKGMSKIRCRRCATDAGPSDHKIRTWQDGGGGRRVGGDRTTVVAVPGVLKYLDSELAAMGIRLRFNVGL